MADKIIFRHDTLANWQEANPILAEGEVGFITDADQAQYKIGDGVSTWNNLPIRGFNGNIVTATGTSDQSVMSQNAVTTELEKLQTAITSATAKDKELEASINNNKSLINSFSNAVDAINATLENEIKRLDNQDNELDDKINSNSESVSALSTALNNEISRVTQALQSGIDEEKQSRMDADIALESNLTETINNKVSEERTRATETESLLEGKITSEVNRATVVEQSLQKSITNTDSRTANIIQLASIEDADVISYITTSCLWIVAGSKAIILMSVNGYKVGAVTQTLIQEGKILYRYNIKEISGTATDSTCWSEWSDNSIATIEWSSTFNMNDYTTQGIYYISGERAETDDNLPIQNTGYISGQITVLDANGCVTQYLKLTNNGGSEGKEYIRTYASGSWSSWRELKQTANLGQVTDEQLKTIVDNGHYEGAIVNSLSDMNNMTTIVTGFLQTIGSGTERLVSGTLFSMEVLNNYAITRVASSLMGVTVPRSVTQVAKILLINDGHYDGTSYLEVQRTKIGDNAFGNWKLVNVI